MTEQELRALVREAIARHLGGAAIANPEPRSLKPEARSPESRMTALSYQMFALADGAVNDGPCLIEPAVMCNHCGYCKSYGH